MKILFAGKIAHLPRQNGPGGERRPEAHVREGDLGLVGARPDEVGRHQGDDEAVAEEAGQVVQEGEEDRRVAGDGAERQAFLLIRTSVFARFRRVHSHIWDED